MVTVKTKWESTEPNPDEGHLKKLWEADLKSLRNSFDEEEIASRRRHASIAPLLKGINVGSAEVDRWSNNDRALSKKALEASQRQFVRPSFDIEVAHQQDVELMKKNAERMGPGNPSWSGVIWGPNYGGSWSSWNGESEEIPNVVINVGGNRIDPRAQAWGEGWWDGDFSEIHAYLSFRFSPPSWGHLHINTYPWLHGYYSLYSNDEWYNSEYARAEVDTWIDVHQNFWRARSYIRRYTRAGDEIHPQAAGRIDGQYPHSYYTNVGQSDTVTIRVGIRLYSYARANGGRSLLNFQAGSANYVFVPYVYWYLHN